MKHINVGIFHDEHLGSKLAKKGTTSDILMFNRKKDDLVFTFMASFEDKLTTKTQIISTIDAAIISFEKITPEIGETVLLLDSVGLKEGIIVIPKYSDTTEIEKIIKDTSLKNFKILNKDIPKMIGFLEKIDPERNISHPTSIIVDHSFSVKGVGEVILGLVKTGTVFKHDKMILLPINKEVVIRSIQMQDKDFNEASAGCRVGLAIKGAKAEEMKRGSLFSTQDYVKTNKKVTLNFSKNPFYKDFKKGRFHLTIGMQSLPANITEINGNKVTIETEKPVCYTKYDNFILIDLNAKKLRHIGTGKIIE